MRKIIPILALYLILPTTTWGQMATSDSGAYAYFVQVLKKDMEKLENQIKQIEEMKSIHKENKKIVESLKGYYQGDLSALIAAAKAQKDILNSPTAILEYLRKVFSDATEQDKYLKDHGYVKIQELLRNEIKDGSSLDVDSFKQFDKRRRMTQAALEKAIVAAEEANQRMPQEIERFEALMNKISNTEDAKSAMDLNNHFQAEILSQLHGIRALLARYLAAASLRYFEGHNPPTEGGENGSSKDDQRSGYMKMLQPILDDEQSQGLNIGNL